MNATGVTGMPVVMPASDFAYPEHAFTTWNTAADGTGSDLPAGSEQYFQAGTTTLYAQWETTGPDPEVDLDSDPDPEPNPEPAAEPKPGLTATSTPDGGLSKTVASDALLPLLAAAAASLLLGAGALTAVRQRKQS